MTFRQCLDNILCPLGYSPGALCHLYCKVGNNCKRISDNGIHIYDPSLVTYYFKEKYCPKNESLGSWTNKGDPKAYFDKVFIKLIDVRKSKPGRPPDDLEVYDI